MTKNEKIEFYTQKCYLYGYIILMKLKDHFEDRQLFEECEAITVVLERVAEKLPIRLNDDVVEDYIAEFWRMGLSGKYAALNFNTYFKDVLEETEKWTRKA